MSLIRRFGPAVLAGAALFLTACSNDIQIGAVISQSGAVATYGEQVKMGLDLALDEINASGGGYKGGVVQLIYKDDATIPDIGEQVTRELIEQDITMIIGAISSSVTLRIAPICEENNVVLLSPSSSVPAISTAGDYIFRNYPSDILEGTSMARFAKDEGFEKVVIFTMDNEFGSGLADVFTKEYESKFRQVIQVFRFPETQNEGFGEMIAETAKLKPDGIYIIAYDKILAGLLTEMHQAKLAAVRMGTASVPQNLPALIGDAADRLIFPRPGWDVESNDPVVVKFVQAFRQRYNQDPDIYAAHGYDALYLFMEAINAAESLHPSNVKIGMSSIKSYQGAAGLTTFDKYGDVVRYPRLFVMHQGRAMPYDRFTEEGLSLARRAR